MWLSKILKSLLFISLVGFLFITPVGGDVANGFNDKSFLFDDVKNVSFLNKTFGTTDVKAIKDEVFKFLVSNDGRAKEAVFTVNDSKLGVKDNIKIVFNELCGHVNSYDLVIPKTCWKNTSYCYNDSSMSFVDVKFMGGANITCVNRYEKFECGVPYVVSDIKVSLKDLKIANTNITEGWCLINGTYYRYFVDWMPVLNISGNVLVDNKWAWWNATGGTITTILDGGVNYTIHTFTSNGNFNVTGIGTNVNVSVLLVAGGGGGGLAAGVNGAGGGGGAGGLLYYANYTLNDSGNYTVKVGSGGTSEGYGSNSSFANLTAVGGGKGGSYPNGGNPGGSGGGRCGYNGAVLAGGTGVAGQGNAGGAGGAVANYGSGGGGGAGMAGGDGLAATNGYGGNGTNYSINGTNVYYAGGGGGGGHQYGIATGGLAGRGGGGAGGDDNFNGNPGTNGTGGGGGGAGNTAGNVGGAGGTGVIIVRYLTIGVTTPVINFNANTTTEGDYSNITQNWLYASLSTNDFSNGNISIYLYNDTALYSNQTAAANFSYNFTNLQNGNYTMNATAYNGTQINTTTSKHYLIYYVTPVCNISGGTIYNITDPVDSLNYTVHVFSTSENFSINNICDNTNVQVLIIAGGGGGGSRCAGGGGAGGLIYNTSYIVTSGSNINISVGTGGTGGSGGYNFGGSNGINSSFGVLVAKGGGGGGTYNAISGSNGGSGGGSGYPGGGWGNGTVGQGNDGGAENADWCGSGGGGAGGDGGQVPSGSIGGDGGNGTNYSTNGTIVCYAGGGGGGADLNGGSASTVNCGGGAGGYNRANNALAGTDGLGGGGGGGANVGGVGKDGGDGIVIVRYLTTGVTTPVINFNANTTTEGDYSNITQNWLYASLSTNNFSNGNISIYLYNDTALYSNQTAAANFSYNFTNLQNGNYTMNATAYNGTQINTTTSKHYLIYYVTPVCNISGGTIYNITDPVDSLNYTVHAFTSNDTFNDNNCTTSVQVLIVAGGGGGADDGGTSHNHAGGGGGAGGLIYNTSYNLINVTTVIVGSGGIADVNGTNSSFGVLVAKGGGAGGVLNQPGNDGGSGGGGGSGDTLGGSSITNQGYPGGNGTSSVTATAAAGGGGSGNYGKNNSGEHIGGNGGDGINYSINGTIVCYAGGGGGGGSTTNGIAVCGGGNGGLSTHGDGYDATAYTGGGGGGAVYASGTKDGGIGGSGIVIVRYLIGGGTTNTCSCPTATNWRIALTDHCNITSSCNVRGYNVSFENGTTGDYVNVSATITATYFNFSAAGSGALCWGEPTGYLNMTT